MMDEKDRLYQAIDKIFPGNQATLRGRLKLSVAGILRTHQSSLDKVGYSGAQAPLWCTDEVRDAWAGWVAMRKLKHKPLTPAAASRAMAKLGRLSNEDPRTAAEILNQSEDHGWTDLYQVTQQANDRQQGNSPEAYRSEFERLEAEGRL